MLVQETPTFCADWPYNSGMTTGVLVGEAIGRRVRDARLAREWDQSKLARRANVSTSYISRLEAGLYKAPSLDRIARIAAALDVAVADLSAPLPAPADTLGLRAELFALGFRADEAPLVEEIATDLAKRAPRQRRALLQAIRTLLPPPTPD